MRPGQRAGAAPEWLIDDATGQVLLTARYAAELSGRPLSTIRGAAEPRACHVATGALYWDADDLKIKLPTMATQQRRPNTKRKGPVGHAAPRSRSVT